MAKPIIGFPRYTTEATFSLGPGAVLTDPTQFPVSNLNTLPLARIARFDASAPIVFDMVFDHTTPISMISLCGHNGSPTSTFDVTLYRRAGDRNPVVPVAGATGSPLPNPSVVLIADGTYSVMARGEASVEWTRVVVIGGVVNVTPPLGSATLTEYRFFNQALNLRQREAYEDTGSTVNWLASYTRDMWPLLWPFGTVPFEDPHFWTGRYTDAEILGGLWTRHLRFASTNIEAARIQVHAQSYDTFDLGMADAAAVWQFSQGFELGASSELRSRTVTKEAKGGTKSFEPREAVAGFKGTVPYMPRLEEQQKAAEFQRQLDVHEPFVFILDEDDDAGTLADSGLMTNVSLGGRTFANYKRMGVPFAFEKAQ